MSYFGSSVPVLKSVPLKDCNNKIRSNSSPSAHTCFPTLLEKTIHCCSLRPTTAASTSIHITERMHQVELLGVSF